MIRRRSLLASAAAGLGSPLVGAAPAAPAAKPLLPQLRIYIPGGAGGGWDQTGRTLGATMQALGLVERVEYENKGGKGGTIGRGAIEQYDLPQGAGVICQHGLQCRTFPQDQSGIARIRLHLGAHIVPIGKNGCGNAKVRIRFGVIEKLYLAHSRPR